MTGVNGSFSVGPSQDSMRKVVLEDAVRFEAVTRGEDVVQVGIKLA